MTDTTLPPTKTVIWRGICGRCPQCGQGALFKAYLKQNDACPSCGEDFSYIRADDGPAWLTILLTAHLLVPVTIYFAMSDVISQPIGLSLMLVLTIGAVLLILPRSKGVFIGMLWLLARKKTAKAA